VKELLPAMAPGGEKKMYSEVLRLCYRLTQVCSNLPYLEYPS
jgi:hypothetical protein